MFKKILNFVKYHNAFSIGFTLIFSLATVSFAASPELQKDFIGAEASVVSVDNSFIVKVDLENFNFNPQIKTVTEDKNSYYVTYNYQTIAIDNAVWKAINQDKVLTVSKVSLNDNYIKDLGLYAFKEISDVINAELQYLNRAQSLERANGLSPKVISTTYSGLIGRHFDPKEEIFPGYAAVILSEKVENKKEELSPDEMSRKIQEILEARRLAEEQNKLIEDEKLRQKEEEIKRLEAERAQQQPVVVPEPEPIPEPTPQPIPEPSATTTPPVVPEPTATTTPPITEPEPVATTTPPTPPPTEPESTSTPETTPEPPPTPSP